jgi:hypothetical protein
MGAQHENQFRVLWAPPRKVDGTEQKHVSCQGALTDEPLAVITNEIRMMMAMEPSGGILNFVWKGSCSVGEIHL